MSGFVDIVVEGYYIERFMNICTNKKIFIWNLKRNKSTILCARVGIKDFKKLREVCKKTGCKMKISNKKGFPFFMHKYKKRKVFVFLLIFVILLIISLSNFIWNIEVTGNTNISADEILKVANEGGLTLGKWKSKINTKEIINKLRLDRDDLAWVGIEIKGTNAKIQVVEADLKPDIINEDEYCNMVATKSGMILKVNAINGTPLVKEGDIVKQGDILIGGWMEGKYTGTRYVHSQGEVQAKVWYTSTKKINIKQTKKDETGNIENKYTININNFKINLFKRLSNFENYDTIEENKKLRLFSDFYLPLEIIKITNKEYKNVEIMYKKEEAKEIAVQQAEEELVSRIEDSTKILNKNINVKEDMEYVEVEVTYEVLENIEAKKKIVF